MSRFKIIMLSLLAVFAVSAVASTSALAVPLAGCYKVAEMGTGNKEIGCGGNTGATKNEYIEVSKFENELVPGEWCAKVKTAGTGNYTTGACTTKKAGENFIKVLVPEGPFYRVSCHKVSAANKGLGEWNKENATTHLCEEVSKKGAGEGEFATRLLKGEIAEIEAEANGNQVLKAGTRTITCTTVKVGTTSVLEGMAFSNFSKSKEVVEYGATGTGDCTVTGNGSACKVTEPIKTNPVVNKTAYEKENATTKEGEGDLLTVFEPESGEVFVTVHFTGTCTVTSTAVEEPSGDKGVIARNLNENHEIVKVGEHEGEDETNELEFPATRITKAFVEEGDVLKKVEAELLAFGATATLEGKIKLKLKGTPHKKFGIFSLT